MSLTATPVPETVVASDYPPTVVSPPAPSAASSSSPAGELPAAEPDPDPLAQTAALHAQHEGLVDSVEEGVGTPAMESQRPARSKNPVPTTPVGEGEALPVPMTAPQGSEANTALATTVDRQPPAPPPARRGGKDVVARDAPTGGPQPSSPGPPRAASRDVASSSQAGRDAAATIAAVGGPALDAVAAQARKPPPGISLRRSKAELQAVLEAEPYPGPFPTHRPAWEVPEQASLGDGELPPGAPGRVRVSDLYPGKYDELVSHRLHTSDSAEHTPPGPPPTVARPAHLARPPL